MRRIGLIGLPGSGKTILADALERAYVMDDASCAECNTPVAIVDNYAEQVAESGDWAIGLDGGWMVSVAISIERYNQERKAASEGAKTIITCGTLLESSVYMAMEFESQQSFATQPELPQLHARVEGGLRFFAAMYMDTFRYNKVFYLPPITAPESEKWKTFDRNLQASFAAFNLVEVEPLTIEEFESPEDLLAKRVEMILKKQGVVDEDPALAD